MRQIIIRLDDACPTMRRAAWSEIERILTDQDVRPIVGVIPDCHDPKLEHDAPDAGFWDRVASWQERGWEIALHGETHVFHDDSPGASALVPFHRRGEYVGRPLVEQRASLAASWREFIAHGVRPRMFMAPWHSFDATTLRALELETEIRWITDGLSWRAFSREGFGWLPQQFFGLREPPFGGVWTVCLHPNGMSLEDMRSFAEQLRDLRRLVIEPAVAMQARLPAFGPLDMAFGRAYWALSVSKRWYWRGRRALGFQAIA